MLSDGEDLCLVVEKVNTGCKGATSGNAECCILDNLNAPDMCIFDGW